MSIRPLFRVARPRAATRPAPRPRPRPVIVAVTDRWRLVGEETGREVLVRDVDGSLHTLYLPDEHPALVAWLARAQAVAA